MAFGLTPPLALPAGTAIAGVADALGSDSESALAALETLDEPALAAAVEPLVGRGVFALSPPCLLVVRASKDGLRRYALLCGDERARAVSSDDGRLQALLEAEARQRPFFHGTTRSGTTYSGFIAADSPAILDCLNAGAAAGTGRELCAVFAGEPWRLPRAIAVPMPAHG